MALASLAHAGVLDANGIIGLAKGGCFSLVPSLFTATWVPHLVVLEVTDALSRAELQAALGDWLAEAVPTAPSLRQTPILTREADRHVLALALDHQPCFIVTGDRGLSNRAAQLQIGSVSAPRMVQLFAEAGLIAAARPHLEQMIQQGFGISQQAYDDIIQHLGE